MPWHFLTLASCYCVRCPAGALGVRTVHQVDAKAQLLVRALLKQANSSAASEKCAASDDEGSGDEAGWLDAAASRQLPGACHEAAQGSGWLSARAAELQGLTGDSDVLPAPRFTSAPGGTDQPLLLDSQLTGTPLKAQLHDGFAHLGCV